MKISRILKVFSVIFIVLSFSGCVDDEDNIKHKDIKTVTVWTADTHSKDVVTKIVADWNESDGKNKGIYIDYQVKENTTYSKMVESSLKSGNAPDFFYADVAKNASNDYLLAIEDLPNGNEIIEKSNICNQEQNTTYNGKHYRIPVSITTRAIIYNTDMFKAAGLVDENGEAKPPKTWKDVREYALKLTDHKKKQYGIIFPAGWHNGWYRSDISATLMNSVGHMGYNSKTGNFDYSALKEIIDYILQIKKDKSYFPGAETLNNDSARAHFANGGIGMKFAFSFDYGVLTDQFPATCRWDVAPLPSLDENSKFKQISSFNYSLLMNKKSADIIGTDVMEEVFCFFAGDEYVRTMYRAGMIIPCKTDSYNDIEFDEKMSQWKKFANLTQISGEAPITPAMKKIDFSPDEVFINEVWTGKKNSAQFVEEMEKIYSDAIK